MEEEEINLTVDSIRNLRSISFGLNKKLRLRASNFAARARKQGMEEEINLTVDSI